MTKRSLNIFRKKAAALAVMGVLAAVPASAGSMIPAFAHRSHVAGGVGFPAVIIGVASVLGLYDIVRRTTCSGDFLGLGGPGFNEPIRPNQNVLPPPNCQPR